MKYVVTMTITDKDGGGCSVVTKVKPDPPMGVHGSAAIAMAAYLTEMVRKVNTPKGAARARAPKR